MNSLWLWIGIAIVVIVLIVVFIAIGKKRGESKKVSFEKPKEEEPKQLTQEQKSGNYQAKSGFNFAPAGSKEPEKVAQEKPQQAKQEQQPALSEQSEPSATDIANAQLNGEEPPATKRPKPAKDKDAAPEKAAKQEETQRQEPAAGEQPKKPAETEQPADADGAGDEAKVESASTPEPESKPAADKPAADKPAADKAEGKGAAGTAAAAAAAAGGVGAAGAAASVDNKTAAADDADKEPADQAEDQSNKPDSAQASAPTSGQAEEEDKEAKGGENSAPAAAEKPAAEGADHRGEPDHEDKDPEDVVSVEAAEVEDESPVFDAVVDDKDADHIEERVDNHEEAEEAAAAADAQTDAAEAAKEQTPVPDGKPAAAGQPTEDIAPAGGRLGGRLSRSQNAIGQGLMGILSAGDLDEDAWEEIEDTLIMADLGTKSTMKVTDSLRDKIAERGVSSEEEARAMLRECLIEACHPEMDRSIRAMPNDGKPAIVMVVGVNGTGKTTTTGKLARVLVSMDHSVLLGAADTFRAAAADQLETWGRRVGAETVRGKEGADPASVAFDAVATGVEQQVDVVLVDTAGRLHTSTDLMDQLGKVKRVVEKKTEVDEVLLVLDATVGQNGLAQARIFREVVDISGVVLTKLDGTAKGGIVFQVQEELGVPVKLVGLGEGADDLAPFEVEGFVDALLGEK